MKNNYKHTKTKFFLIDGFSEAFNTTITDDQAKKIKSVQDVIDILSKM